MQKNVQEMEEYMKNQQDGNFPRDSSFMANFAKLTLSVHEN